ncbi:hypothetical protein HNY73_008095 [Argiope bruennichi]|uniref:Uncharacterized protein n=1 Tax=Argiope bruennichi TaxID=94029 RepID=A0A8T0F591_ARGBR|nr:hypothetical protein HNY73_008095 [Argiope bruennichi]
MRARSGPVPITTPSFDLCIDISHQKHTSITMLNKRIYKGRDIDPCRARSASSEHGHLVSSRHPTTAHQKHAKYKVKKIKRTVGCIPSKQCPLPNTNTSSNLYLPSETYKNTRLNKGINKRRVSGPLPSAQCQFRARTLSLETKLSLEVLRVVWCTLIPLFVVTGCEFADGSAWKDKPGGGLLIGIPDPCSQHTYAFPMYLSKFGRGNPHL